MEIFLAKTNLLEVTNLMLLKINEQLQKENKELKEELERLKQWNTI